MTIAQLLVWSNTIPSLISAGIMVEGQIAGLIKSFHSNLTDDEMNVILLALIASATAHRDLAKKDAGE